MSVRTAGRLLLALAAAGAAGVVVLWQVSGALDVGLVVIVVLLVVGATWTVVADERRAADRARAAEPPAS